MQFLLELFKQNFLTFLTLAAAGIVIIFLGVINETIKTKLKDIVSKVVKKFTKESAGQKHNITQVANMIDKINDAILEVRIKMKADRAYIIQFHNGETFSANNPRWKMSQTFETCMDGISYTGDLIKNMDVTVVWDYLKVIFFDPEKEAVPGVEAFIKNRACALEFCHHPRKSYLVTTTKMDRNRGYTRSLIEQQGIKYMIQTPILNADNQPIGIIGVDYCSDERFEQAISSTEFTSCVLCQTASEISLSWELDKQTKQETLDTQRNLLADEIKRYK